VIKLRGLTKLTQDRDAIDPTFHEKIGHAIQRRFINPAIIMERSRSDWDDSLDSTCQDQDHPPLDLSRPAMVVRYSR
jgi:hypothetical protein